MKTVKTKSRSLGAEILSILLFASAVFAFASLATYHAGDPSIFSNSDEPARNACGAVGAHLAAILLGSVGVGAFLVPAALLFVSATLREGNGWVRLSGILAGMAVAVMALTVFATLQWAEWPFRDSTLLTGGAFGAWVAESLKRAFNPLGASIVSLVAFCLALVLSTPVSIAQILGRVLRATASAVWKVGRLAGAYLLYLGGLLAVRLAHAAGTGSHRLAFALATRARERITAARQAFAARGAVAGDASASSGEIVLGGEDEALEIGAMSPGQGEESEGAAASAGAVPEAALAAAPAQGELRIFAPAVRAEESEAAGDAGTKANPAAERAAAKLARAAHARKGAWKLPTVEFLKRPPKTSANVDRDRLIANSQILRQKFLDFGIEGEVTAVRPGPVITLYEFKPGPGVKVSRIAALADDLSMALSAQSVRILAPLPGRSVVGIEIPSDERETVYLREFLQHPDFYGPKHQIPVVMGKDISGQTQLSDLARMPHLLCAGQTGSGKSVFMNGLICSLFYRFTPDELRMILVDPKFIEFRAYQDIPHLLLPVVDDPKAASTALKWAVREMERRYRILAMMGVRNLLSYNQRVEEMGPEVVRDLLVDSEENQSGKIAKVAGGDWMGSFEPDETGAPRIGKLPYIVVVIDELADLMMVARKEVEISIARLSQKARAAGIHLLVATQRPSTDVITGLIKANLPSRASFQLASHVDSKTIIDRGGAERLLGQGDMLFIPPGTHQPARLHGAYVDDDEIGKVTAFLRGQGDPVYRDEILVDDEEDEFDAEDGEQGGDELLDEAVELVKRSGHASASFLQRHLKVGYNRAARMIETMEEKGIVGPADGARPREVLVR